MKIRRIESILRETIATYDARTPVTGWPDAVKVLAPLIQDRPRETFAVLLLNGRHRPMGIELVSEGTVSSALVHPREVFGAAVRMGASAVIVAHNHPSGDPEPSPEDLTVTRRLIEAGKLLGIPLLDSLVIGAPDDNAQPRTVSLRASHANGAGFLA